jgi:transcriptional regulator with XRE-family HTH domain
MGKRKELPLVESLREAIRNSGMSISELGRKAGVSQPQLSRFLNGERTLTLPAAAKVCQTLGLRLIGPGGFFKRSDKGLRPAD